MVAANNLGRHELESKRRYNKVQEIRPSQGEPIPEWHCAGSSLFASAQNACATHALHMQHTDLKRGGQCSDDLAVDMDTHAAQTNAATKVVKVSARRIPQ